MLFDALRYLAKKKWELFGWNEHGLTFYFYMQLTGESGSKPQNGEYQAGLCVVFCLVLVVQWLFRAAIIASKPQLRVANP